MAVKLAGAIKLKYVVSNNSQEVSFLIEVAFRDDPGNRIYDRGVKPVLRKGTNLKLHSCRALETLEYRERRLAAALRNVYQRTRGKPYHSAVDLAHEEKRVEIHIKLF